MTHLWVLGDSWTDPAYGDNGRCGWPQKVAAALGWGLVCSGSSGAGYLNTNSLLVNYRIQAVRGTGVGASAVVVWGSCNDADRDPADVAEAAADTYRLIRALCPGAPLLVYGPQWWDTEPHPLLPALSAAVRGAAWSTAAPFTDPLRWFAGRPDLLNGEVHPGCRGHDVIAARVLHDLRVTASWTTPPPPLDRGGWRGYPRAYPRAYEPA